MKRKIIWLVVSGLMALSLVLAACAPKVTEEKKEVVTEKKEMVTEKKEMVTEKKEMVTEKKGEMVVDALGRLVPKPRYGGWLNLVEMKDPDVGFSRSGLNRVGYPMGYLKLTNDPLIMRDRLKGPGATGEWGLYTIYPSHDLMVGGLAESWEIIQPNILKFKIRKGVHWHDKAPTYGAELTAEDVVYTFMARYGGKWATSGFPRFYPDLSNLKNPEESVYIDPADPWTVVMKSAPGKLGELWEVVSNFDYIVPKALGPIEGEGFGDWRGVVGTGPMLLTDYVMGSSLTWQRNPNYWLKDQFHPQNQLPYLDGVKYFIIPDLSTRLAALRTGRIDIIPDMAAEDAKSLIRTNPELLWKERLGSGSGFAMRHDRAPFNDVRVRRAMQMAIDLDEIIGDYYKGNAQKLWWPVQDIPEHKLAWVPLEQMPQSVQELYEYHPDKARKLLAEAGYPNGFTTSVIVSAAQEEYIDLASIVAAYWAKVGVTLKIDLKEDAVFRAMATAKTYEQGAWGGQGAAPNEFHMYTFSKVGSGMNYAMANEPLIEETFKRTQANYFNWAEVSRIVKEVAPELIMLAVHQRLPQPMQYSMWQPWVKGYYGEYQPDYIMQFRMAPISRYVWIDQDLKKAIGR